VAAEIAMIRWTVVGLFRAAAITVISAATGFGFLVFLDGSRIWTPSTGLKEVFFLLGLIAAIVMGLLLLRLWPTHSDQNKPPPPLAG
jgi:hypothetical protein